MNSRPSKRTTTYLRLFVVAILLTFAAGWLLTDFLGTVAEKGFQKECEREAALTQLFLHDNLEDATNAAKSLGPAEAIVAALASGSSSDLERANSLLDRINKNFEMSVCYLIDRNGLTIASSNRQEKDSFVGLSFANRPYFTRAASEGLTTYFALGKVSHERGYYAAVPVLDSAGTLSGVVVVKRNVAPVEAFFKQYAHAFLVSPEGIIFITSREDLLFRNLWPVSEERRAGLLASQQFGNLSFTPLLAAEPKSGTYVRLDEEKHYVQRLPFGNDGWTLVLLDHPEIVATYQTFGIVLTGVFTLLLCFFFNILLYKNRSQELTDDLLKSREDFARSLKGYAQRLEYVLAGSNDATWEWDIVADQAILNKRYYEMVEYPPGEVNADLAFFIKTIHPEDVADVQRRVQDNLQGKTSEYEAQYRLVTRSGRVRQVMGRGKVVSFDEDGRPCKMAGVITDVTEMKRLSEEVNRISNLESIGLLSGGLAHDFNNVLNIIYGNISFAKMLAGGNAAVIEPLTDAEEACEHARELGLRLQSFSQRNAPVQELLSLPVLIDQVAGTLLNGANILYTIAVADDLCPVQGDPRQIRQVLVNLLTNAKEAMTAGGRVTIQMANYPVDGNSGLPLQAGDYVCILLADEGRGIAAENLPKIFDPYFSTKDTYSQKGLGLGLTTCHAILKRHNGHISVESTVGIGTRITLYLPAAARNEGAKKELP
ncbi:MAG: ATP-binding protein [Desulfuromonadales bacterium]|nr:ATP-binding protein [Desulfuromonadales bacterium]